VGPKTSLSSFEKALLVTARLSQHLPNSFADILIVTPQLQSQIQSAFLNAHSTAGSCAVTAMSVFSLRSQTACVGPRITAHSTQSSTSSESAPNLAKPVHQLLSYCPSDKPSLISPVFTELGVNPPVFMELGYSTAKAVTPTSVRLLLTSCTNLLIRTPHL